MTADGIRAQLTERPFRPFDVHTASGRMYYVPHPDFAWISPSGRDLLVATETDAVAVLSLLHVAEMQTADSREASA
jgi:hypothetical protein